MLGHSTFADIGLQDRLMIGDLLARYSIRRDDRDLDALMECFADGASYSRAGSKVVGKDAVRAFFANSIERYDLTRHLTHTYILQRIDSGRVTGVVTGSADLILGGVLIKAAYRYADVYAKPAGEWLILERTIAFIYAMPANDLGSGFSDERRIRWPGQGPQVAEIL